MCVLKVYINGFSKDLILFLNIYAFRTISSISVYVVVCPPTLFLLTAAWYTTVYTLHTSLNHYTPLVDTEVAPTSLTTINTPHKCPFLGCVWVSLGYIPRSGIASSYGTWILCLNCVRLLSIMVTSVCICVCLCVCEHILRA